MAKSKAIITAILAAITLTGCTLSLRDFPEEPSTDDAFYVEKVEVTKAPDKTTYIEEEVFDPSGMEAVATWNDGFTENIETVIDYPTDKLVKGMTKVELEYEDFKFYVPITVTGLPQVTTLTVKNYPRQHYFVGEDFDPSGLILHAVFDDGTEKDVVDGYEYDKTLTASTKKVTITYRKKTVDIPVTMVAGIAKKFEAEDFKLMGAAEITNSTTTTEDINNPSNGAFIGKMNKSNNSGFTFTLVSDKDSAAKFYFTLGKNGTKAYKYGETHKMTIAYENSMATLTTDAFIEVGGWYDWARYEMFTIELKEGLNNITIINNGKESSNIDYIEVLTDAELTLSNEEVVLKGSSMECEDMTPIGGSYVEREPNCGEPSGGYYIGGMNSSKDGAGVRFMIKSTMSCNVQLFAQISKNGSYAYNFFEHHTITVYNDDGEAPLVINKAYLTANGMSDTKIAKGSGWFNWTEVTLLNQFPISDGYTVFEIRVNSGGCSGNFDYIKLTNITNSEHGFEFYNPQRLEAEDGIMTSNTKYVYEPISTATSYNNPSGRGFVTDMTQANASFTYTVNAKEATQTSLLASIGLDANAYNFSENHNVIVTHEDGTTTDFIYNNVKVDSTTSNKGYEWRLFNLGQITLKAGLNTIKIVHTTTSGSGNFDYLLLGTTKDVVSSTKVEKRYEIEDGTYTDVTLVEDTTRGASGDAYINIGTASTATFTVEFSVTRESYVTFFLNVGLTTDAAAQIVAQYTIKYIDANGVESEYLPGYNFIKATGDSGYCWREVNMGFMVAKPGVNKFVFSRKKGTSQHGFDYLDITAYTPLA